MVTYGALVWFIRIVASSMNCQVGLVAEFFTAKFAGVG